MARKQIAIFVILLFAANFNLYASDTDRIDLLEKEILQLKARLSKLESAGATSTSAQDISNLADGWKSISNWRKLTTYMSPNDVRNILGEPERLDGGAVATWFYLNGGRVVFMNGKTYQWTEPRNKR